MVGIRRLLPVCFLLLFAGVIAAADKNVTGVLDKFDGKHKSFVVKVPVKNKKDKFEDKFYSIPEKLSVIDEKGNDVKPDDLGKFIGKPVTITLKPTKVGNKIEDLLTVVNFGKVDVAKADDKGKEKDKKTAVAAKDKKEEMKKEDGKPVAKALESKDGKGVEAKIVSLDAAKGEIVVEIGGVKQTLKVDKETKFTGPRGGDRGEGPKVLEEEAKEGEVLNKPAGKSIRVVFDKVRGKDRVQEIVLPVNIKE